MSAKEQYTRLKTHREQFLWRARANAKLTLPSLIPGEYQGSDYTYLNYEPYQSVGAEGVINLASRLLIALLPPGRNFFRFDIPPAVYATAVTNPEIKQKITDWKQIMSGWEAAAQAAVDQSNWRIMTNASLQQLIVAGNVLEVFDEETNNIKLYRLDQYVVRRDWMGNLFEIIIEEIVDRDALPEEAQALTTKEKDICLYTVIKRNKNKYNVYQEVEEERVPGAETEYLLEDLPYIPLRWNVIPGCSYGRSKIDEHVGDLRSLEGLEKAALEGAALASRHLIMIKPSATVGGLRRKIAEAKNGDVLVGDWEQIQMMEFQNRSGMQITVEFARDVEARLRYAFLMHRAVQRNAERVTATEINAMIEELENSLGGVYSMLSHEMMEKRLHLLIKNLQRNKIIPKWNEGDITPRTITGLEALSRERDVMRVRTAAEILQMFGEPALQAIEITDLIRQALIGLGLQDVTLTRGEITAKQNEALQQEALAKGLANAIPQAIKQSE